MSLPTTIMIPSQPTPGYAQCLRRAPTMTMEEQRRLWPSSNVHYKGPGAGKVAKYSGSRAFECQNCGMNNHSLATCVGPVDQDFCVYGCPIHGTWQHSYDECWHPLAFTQETIALQLIRRRNGKPPIFSRRLATTPLFSDGVGPLSREQVEHNIEERGNWHLHAYNTEVWLARARRFGADSEEPQQPETSGGVTNEPRGRASIRDIDRYRPSAGPRLRRSRSPPALRSGVDQERQHARSSTRRDAPEESRYRSRSPIRRGNGRDTESSDLLGPAFNTRDVAEQRHRRESPQRGRSVTIGGSADDQVVLEQSQDAPQRGRSVTIGGSVDDQVVFEQSQDAPQRGRSVTIGGSVDDQVVSKQAPQRYRSVTLGSGVDDREISEQNRRQEVSQRDRSATLGSSSDEQSYVDSFGRTRYYRDSDRPDTRKESRYEDRPVSRHAGFDDPRSSSHQSFHHGAPRRGSNWSSNPVQVPRPYGNPNPFPQRHARRNRQGGGNNNGGYSNNRHPVDRPEHDSYVPHRDHRDQERSRSRSEHGDFDRTDGRSRARHGDYTVAGPIPDLFPYRIESRNRQGSGQGSRQRRRQRDQQETRTESRFPPAAPLVSGFHVQPTSSRRPDPAAGGEEDQSESDRSRFYREQNPEPETAPASPLYQNR